MSVGKIAVVTGATGGIGKVLVGSLEKIGITCISVDITKSQKENFHTCDFGNPEEVRVLGKKISTKFKVIDFLFNVAGIGIYKDIEKLSISEWINSININLNAPFILTKGLLKSLQKSKRPVVVNVGSGMGTIAQAGRSAYCSSKFGLRGLSLSLSKELKPKGIDVTLLTLGSVMTNFGTGGIKLRKHLEKAGKKYLTPSQVSKRLIEIINSPIIHPEYVMYPRGYE